MSRPAIKSWVRIGAKLVVRAGWAPIGVFLLHVLLSQVLQLYRPFPHLDMPIHALGGAAMAYFLSRCFAAVPETVVAAGGGRRAVEALLVATATVTVAVFWEFAEFICDHAFHTRMQGGLEDTLCDLLMGTTGAALYLTIAWRRGALGRIQPIDPPAPATGAR